MKWSHAPSPGVSRVFLVLLVVGEGFGCGVVVLELIVDLLKYNVTVLPRYSYRCLVILS